MKKIKNISHVGIAEHMKQLKNAKIPEPGKLVMEVKFTEMLPQIVRDILPPHAAEFTAVSKYVLCYEKTRYMNGFEYWYETQEREIL